MGNVSFKILDIKDLDSTVLKNFNRYQETKRVWFEENGEFKLKDDFFVDEWNDEKKIQVIASLQNCIRSGGSVIGAYNNQDLIGFANVEGELFGSDQQYLELSYIHISNEYRGSGIGKELFTLICREAKEKGAKKLYIAAHPSEATQHFYRSVGCTYAKEINEEIFKKEPLDLQLECTL